MKFLISKLIIWPVDKSQTPRILSFDTSKVNVLTGGSGRGKSSIIHVIEYCLASSRNGISVGPIRDKSSAFGILIELEKTQLLLIRESTGNTVSNSFHKIEDTSITIPTSVEEFPYHMSQIKEYLNNLFSFAEQGQAEKSVINSLENQRPSFRTSISLNFQPQNIVANQNILFYKADSSVSKEKLRLFFPYYLNIEDNEILEYKSYLKRIKRQLKIQEVRHSENVEKYYSVNAELLKLYHKAIDFGIIDENKMAILDDNFVISQLESLKNVDVSNVLIPKNQTIKSSERIFNLLKDERKQAEHLEDLSRKLVLLNSVSANNIDIGNNNIQKEARLSPLSWILKHEIKDHTCPFCNVESSIEDKFENLSLLRSRIGGLIDKVKDSNLILKKEITKVKEEITNTESALNEIRTVLSVENSNEDKYNYIQTNASINKFIGTVETSLSEFETLSDNISTYDTSFLREEIERVEKIVGRDALKKRYDDTISAINTNIKKYAELLELQGSNLEISLDIKDELTIVFNPETVSAYTLNQMGSGENYMGYHISTMLGIHEYLVGITNSKIAPFLIFDQPSQAYFPEGDDENDEDTSKLKNLFSTLSEFNKITKGKVQVIVLEHAGEKNWNTFDNIHMVERWRDNNDNRNNSKLIPLDWI
ncbi:Protein of unknown function [Sphingobacterium nematocida]|uniref:DUF3732 domain-containing protein n=1 Tax=Sphingobacterium nematocida TaxID=1513896 RepID=A0A1T5GHP6_9SPHI|nr:DUF3732 domain-containing protein [Sphingobacterium nematocida]SKC07938.1 Protein of unknown function [Sphingobacterium nematocida]